MSDPGSKIQEQSSIDVSLGRWFRTLTVAERLQACTNFAHFAARFQKDLSKISGQPIVIPAVEENDQAHETSENG